MLYPEISHEVMAANSIIDRYYYWIINRYYIIIIAGVNLPLTLTLIPPPFTGINPDQKWIDDDDDDDDYCAGCQSLDIPSYYI